MGRIRIFCVLEQRSARDRVIFLWVALSVEWGLEIQRKDIGGFKVYISKCLKRKRVKLGKFQPFLDISFFLFLYFEEKPINHKMLALQLKLAKRKKIYIC